MTRTGRFALFFVGISLLFAGLLLAYPASPAYEQAFSHEKTTDTAPPADRESAYYRRLPAGQQALVDRALAGETVRVPGSERLPPEVVFHEERGAFYHFDRTRYYDLDRTPAQAGLLALAGGIGATVAALRRETGR